MKRPNINENANANASRDTSAFYVAKSSRWKKLRDKSLVPKCKYAQIVRNGYRPETLKEIEKAPSVEDMASIQPFCSAMGYFGRVAFEQTQMKIAAERLLQECNYPGEDPVSYAGTTPYHLYSMVNLDFSSFIICAKRLCDSMDAEIRKQFSSRAYESWKSIASDFFDSSIEYAFCYEYRDCIEHEGACISVVNIDNANQTADFAINLGSELASSKMKSMVMKRLSAFAEEKMAVGRQPWIPVGPCAQTYYRQISLLVSGYCKMLIGVAEITEAAFVEKLRELPDGVNGIILPSEAFVGDEDRGEYPHVLSFPDAAELSSAKQWTD